MKHFFATKHIAAYVLGFFILLFPFSIQAQSFGGTDINITGLTSTLLACKSADGQSADEWITKGVGKVTALASRGVASVTTLFTGGAKNGQAVGGLFCGEKCKSDINGKIAKGQADCVALAFKNAGSTVSSPVPVKADSVVDEIKDLKKETVDTAKTIGAQQSKQVTCSNALAKFALNKALKTVTTTALNYINTGMNGAPFYVTDPSTYFKNMYKEILDRNIPKTNFTLDGNAAGTDVLNEKINAIITGQVTGKIPNFVKTQNSIAGVLDGADKKVSNWNTFMNAASKDGGLGKYLSKIDDINRQVSEEEKNAQQELLQGRGFFSQKKCVKYSRQVDGNGERVCAQFTVVTPGSVIANQADTVTSSQIRQLETADKISDLIAGVVDSYLNKWLQKGLRNTGDATPLTNTGFGNPYANTLSIPGSDYSGSGGINGSGSTAQTANGADLGGDFDISHTTQLAKILAVQNTFLHKAQDSINANKKLVAQTGALDYCLPGPNPSWLTYSSDSNTMFTNAVADGVGDQDDYADPKWSKEYFATDRFGFFDSVTDSVVPYKAKIFEISPAHIPFRYQVDVPDNSGFLDIACNIGSSLLNGKGFNTSCSHTETREKKMPTPSDEVADAFNQWFASYANELNTRYSIENITNQFAIAAPLVDPKISYPFIRGQVRAMVRQANTLVDYNAQLQENADAYGETIDKTEDTIKKMQDIYSDVLAIVKVARARHIATQKAQGITVSEQCLDKKYALNMNTAGEAAQETDADSDSTVIQSQFAQYDFYENLCNTKSGIANALCTPPTIKAVAKIPYVATVDAPSCIQNSSTDLASKYENRSFIANIGSLKLKKYKAFNVTISPLKKLPPGNYHVEVKKKIIADFYKAEQKGDLDQLRHGGSGERPDPISAYIPEETPHIELVESGTVAKFSSPQYVSAVVAMPRHPFRFNPAYVGYYCDDRYLGAINTQLRIEPNNGGYWRSIFRGQMYNPPGALSPKASWLPDFPTKGDLCPVTLSRFETAYPQPDAWKGGPDPNIVYSQDVTELKDISAPVLNIDAQYETYRNGRQVGNDDCSKACHSDLVEVFSHSVEQYIPKKVVYTVTVTDKNTNQRLSVSTVSVPFEPFYITGTTNVKKLFPNTEITSYDATKEVPAGTLVRNVDGGSYLTEQLGKYQAPQTTNIGLCQN